MAIMVEQVLLDCIVRFYYYLRMYSGQKSVNVIRSDKTSHIAAKKIVNLLNLITLFLNTVF